MKQFKYYAGLGLAALMGACSANEPDVLTPAEPVVNPDGSAYMAVRILDATGMQGNPVTRGDDDDVTPGNDYSAGSGYETKVTKGLFLFFDEAGTFVTRVNQWTTDVADPETEGTDIKIEHKAKGILVLNNLKDDALPKYMVCVLNNASFEPGATLKETLAKLNSIYSADKYTATGDDKTNDGKPLFVMSTTSYFIKDNSGSDFDTRHQDYSADENKNPLYFTTVLAKEDYKKSAAAAQEAGNTVTVYVERLAAKVKLSNAVTGQDKATFTYVAKQYDGYKINMTIAGSDNDLDKDHNELYVVVEGWDINATVAEDNSYMFKNLSDSWATNDVWAGWQKASDKRSFWGQSTLYDQDPSGKLTYLDYNSLENTVGGVDYCAEHTNTTANILNNNEIIKKNVTSVVLKARVFEKTGEGTAATYAPAELVEHVGLHFKKSDFNNYVLNSINASSTSLNIWKRTKHNATGETDKDGNPVYEDNYEQISGNCFTFASKADGKTGEVVIKAALPKLAEGESYWHRTVSGGKETWTAYPAAASEGNLTADQQLDKYVTDLKLAPVYVYTDGKMYYNIPIKHLNEDKTKEGGYGVVRNHLYDVSFSKIEKIGHAVFNPGDASAKGEPIIPDDDDNDTYFLGADINILSWKIVKQDIEL